MEDFTLGLFLFWVVFPFYCSLYCEFCQVNGINISHKKESKKEESIIYPEDVIKYLDSDDSELIELKEEVLNNKQVLTKNEPALIETHTEANNLVSTIMEYQKDSLPKLELLHCVELRKIASKLGIRTSVKGRVQKKDKLVKQIQQKLDTDPTNNTAEIIAACLQ